MRRALCLLTIMLAVVTAQAQRGQDFASKFMLMNQNDTAVQCVTVSPKMMEQLLKSPAENRNGNIMQAIAKLKSARIVSGNADYYQKAIELLEKNRKRFKAEQEFRGEESHGAFYTRRDKKGNTVELIMLLEEPQNDRFTIVNLTGDIDEEFLCFLYNNH